MFDEESRGCNDDLLAADPAWLPEIMVPRNHGDDPFACPCCANVFGQILKDSGICLANHGQALERAGAPVQGDAWLVNATIHTMDKDRPTADAMWVKDGKIAWLGQRGQAPKEVDDWQPVDCAGKVILPGFIDPHMHLAPLAMLHSFENIGPFRYASTAAALVRLSEIAATTPRGEWIVARQFDPSLQSGPAYLTREYLDEVSTDHPIFVYNASLHLAYCNSPALRIAGISANTPDPAGAELGRDTQGEPNGVLKAGPAMALVARHNPALKQQNLAEACLDVFRQANAVGITLLCDQGTGLFQGAGELDLYRSLRNSQRMTTRFRYALSQAQAARWDQTDIHWGQGDEWLRVTGWKVVSDGSNQGRTGLQREAFLGQHNDTAASRGIAYIEADELNNVVRKRLQQGWAVCVHANGDAAIDRVLDAYEEAAELGLDLHAKRCRIEHCSILHDEQIDRMAALGVSPSFLIGHVYYWGKTFVEDIFGQAKAEKLDRTASCQAKGIRWTLHSDDPVTEMNPLRCIENAVTRSMWRSHDILAADERIPVDAALRAMTIDAAWQCHSDHEVGSLEPGKYADFVVLSEDPYRVAPDKLAQIRVEQTWVNGQKVYSQAQ